LAVDESTPLIFAEELIELKYAVVRVARRPDGQVGARFLIGARKPNGCCLSESGPTRRNSELVLTC